MKIISKSTVRTLLFTAALLSTPVHAGLTDIADSPLSTSGNISVKPNLLFILDDSGSMGRAYMPDSVSSDSSRFCYRNYLYNGVYYNPNTTYALPVDAAGLAYPNSSFTAASTDGFTGGTTKNLGSQFRAGNDSSDRAAYYYNYTGTSPATPARDICYADTSYTKVTVGATSGPGGTDERQNFANWYTYYRDRLNTMKSAAGLAFKNIDNTYRVGFTTISYTGTDSTNAMFLKIADFDSPQKTSWYSKLYASTANSSTPLRGALSKAGRIYAGRLLTGSNDPVQYSCQQNFTILSTDGYWNTGDESTSSPKYGPYKVDNTTSVGQQDGDEARPYLDGATTTYTRSTSQIQQRQDQISRSTSQLLQRTTQIQSASSTLQSRTGTLQQTGSTWEWRTKNRMRTATLQWQSKYQEKYGKLQKRIGSGSYSDVGAGGTCTPGGSGSSQVYCRINDDSWSYVSTYPGTCTETYNSSGTSTADASGNVTDCRTSSSYSSLMDIGANAECDDDLSNLRCEIRNESSSFYVSTYPGTCTETFNGSGLSTTDANGLVVSDCSTASSWSSWAEVGGGGTCTASSNVQCQTGSTTTTVSSCTASGATSCQYSWSNWSNVSSCTTVAADTGPTYTTASATECRYNTAAWVNASSCTPVAQSGSSPYSVGTATQCQTLYNGNATDCAAAGTVTNGGQCYIGASACTPGSSGGQTISCVGPVLTGPTYVASCADQTASSGNGWTTTTCTTNPIQAPTPVASCTAATPTEANNYVTTSCNTVTTGPTSVPSCTAALPSAANSYTTTTCGVGSSSGGTSNTLADVAEYYYRTDLRTAALGNCAGAQGAGVDVCENNVPGATPDLNPQQHMTTFTLGLGANGTLIYSDNYLSGGSADYNDIVSGNKDWPDPITNTQEERIDDLWHAGVNGRGVYYSARDSASLITGLSNALAGVTARTGAAAAAATSSLEPVPGDNYLFVAKYTTVSWTGDLVAETIDTLTGTISDTPVWSAQAELDSKVSASSDTRTIYTFDGATASKLKSFTWAALNGTEQGYFNSMCSPTALLSQCPTLTLAEQADASGQNLVNYLRGQNGNEATLYRDREHVLGDMVSSQPVYVKQPPFAYLDDGYQSFKAISRTPMVYVSANDGMLHAFDAATGTEQWAYIPPMVMSNLYRLADKSYSANHRYYVDGSPTMADYCPNAPASACSSSEWVTILVGGLNAGGRGYYALDITDPAAPKALWNFTSDDDADLGYTFGNPVVTKRQDGTWVVIFTSGYNNVSSGDGKGHLYVVNAHTGALLEKIGNNTGSTTTPSGLSKINAWITADTDNTAERIYGGDLLGNLWRFTLDSGSPPAAPVSTAGNAFLLAEVGQINGAGIQPITTRPELSEVPYNGTDYVVVEFGTGRYLGLTDKSNTDLQSVYAIKDDLSNTGLGLARTAGTLVSQTLSNFTGSNGETLRTASNNPVDWSAKSGWYVDLDPGNTSPGERVNVDVQLQLGSLTVAANVPSSNACNVGGYSFLYHFDFRSGSYLTTATQNAVGSKLTSNTLVAGMNTIRLTSGKVYTIVCGTDGVCRPEETPPPVTSGGALERSSWRELIQ